jgi:hypothetical protein
LERVAFENPDAVRSTPITKQRPSRSSEEALLPWTTCSGFSARAFLGIGENQPNLYLFSIH